MALDAEDFDFQGLGDKLTSTILDSFDDALGKIKLSSIGNSLVTALKEVKMSKVIEDSLTKSSDVKAAMKDIQKKLEDGFNKIKFKVGDITIPDLPDQVVKVAADTSNFKLPKAKPIDIPVRYKYEKLQSQKSEPITVPVEYEYGKFQLPKGQELEVPVSYVYSKFNLPKTSKIDVPVEYNYEKLTLPKVKELTVPVHYKVDNLSLPKTPQLQVLVNYEYSKLTLPKANPIKAPVEFVYDKLILPKVEAVKVGVKYTYNKLVLPKVGKLQVGVKYAYDKLSLPKAADVVAKVKFAVDKLTLPKVPNIVVAVKYLYDKFTLPKVEDVPVNVTPDTVKLASGLTEVVDKTKTAVDGIFVPRTISVDVDTTNAEKKLSSTFSTTNTPITAVSQSAASAPEIKTSSFTQAGDSVKLLVNLLDQAAKKTTITSELYNQILDTANKIVETKRMEKSAIDDIIASLQSKVALESAPQRSSTRQGAANAGATATPTVKPVLDASSLESKLTSLLETFSKGISLLFKKLDTKPLDRVETFARSGLAPMRLFDTDGIDGVASEIQDLNSELQNVNLTQKAVVRNSNEEYGLAERRVKLMLDMRNASREQLEQAAAQLKLNTANFQSNQQLAFAIKSRIIDLYKEKQLKEDILSATEDYNKAVRQAGEDILIKGLIVQLNLSEDEVAQKARLLALENERLGLGKTLTAQQVEQLKHDNQHLRHKREEVELVEHVAEYQLKINEEVEELTMSYKKLGATMRATLANPTLAKGVIVASAIQGVHALTHAMHDFKETGMNAGEAVSAAMRSFSVASLLGLSKSADVTKALATQFGNLNTLTDKQIDSVGKLAANNGLAGEEATNLVMSMSRMPGMTRDTAANSEKMFKEIGKTKGVIPAQIMKEMAKNTGNMALYSKGGAEGFAKAAAQAKRMGIELSSVLSAAEKTLDFESSINAQMEASVLLGRELNMDKLRQATLSGDANAIMREQQNLIRQAGGLDNMNLLQKKKVAEMMGMSVEEMVKMNDEAQFQNEHFGEQAGILSNITGYALKYGEAFANAAMQFGPLIASIISLASNMMMLNAIKAQGTGVTATNTAADAANTGTKTANTGAITANNAATVAAAGAKNIDTVATNTNTTASRLNEMQMKAYKAMRAASVPATQAMAAARAMDTSATTANTGATTANTAAGGFWNTVKGIGNSIMNSSIVLWIREKAAIVLSTASKYATIAAETAWNAAKAAGNFLMSTSIGMWIAEKANILGSTIAKWANVGANTAVATSAGAAATATAGSGTAAAGASGGFLAFGASLGTFGTLAAPVVPVLLAIGAAILMATPALYVLGEVVKGVAVVVGNVLMKALEMLPAIINAVAQGFVTVFQTLVANWPVLIPVAVGVAALSLSFIGLAGALGILGGTAMLVAPGLLAVAAVLAATGVAVYLVGQGMNLIVDSFNKLKEIKTDVVVNLAKAVGILALTAAVLAPIAPLMILGALGIAALGLALIPLATGLEKLTAIDTKNITGLGTSLLSLSAAMALIGVTAPFIALGSGAMILLSKGIDPLAEAFKKLSGLKADGLIEFGKNIMGFAVATAYLGLMSPLIIMGSAALYALSFALKPLGETLSQVNTLNPDNLLVFGKALVGFAATAAYLGIISPLIVLGSVAIAALGLALKPFATSLLMATSISPDAVLAFGKAVGGFALMASYLGMLSPLIILGAGAVAILGFALMPAAAVFERIQKLDFKAVEQFGITLGKFAMAAAGLAFAAPLMIIGAAAIGFLGAALQPAALAFAMVQKLDMKAVDQFGITLAKFAVAAALIGPLAPLMILGAIGIGALGLALMPVASAFQMVAGLDSKGLELFALSLGKFSAIAAGLGLVAPLMILGAAGIVILGKGLDLVAGAFQKVQNLKAEPIEMFGFAIGKFSAIAAGLGVLSPLILLGSMAIAYLGLSLGAVADSFIKVAAIDSKKIEEFGIVLGKFALGAAALAPLTPLILISAAAIAVLGMSLMPFAIALSIAAPATELMSKTLQQLATKETVDNLMLLSTSLFSVAKALGAVGIAGILALPALGAVTAMSAVTSMFGGGATKAEGTAPETKGVAPTPAPVPVATTATGTAPATTQGTATQSQSQNVDLTPLMTKMDELIAVMRSGGTIVMDGQKVADVVQRNIKTLTYGG